MFSIPDSPQTNMTPHELGKMARVIAGLIKSAGASLSLKDQMEQCAREALRLKHKCKDQHVDVYDSLVQANDSFQNLNDTSSCNLFDFVFNALITASDILAPIDKSLHPALVFLNQNIRNIPKQQQRVFEYFFEYRTNTIRIDRSFKYHVWQDYAVSYNMIKEAIRKCSDLLGSVSTASISRDGDYLHWIGNPSPGDPE